MSELAREIITGVMRREGWDTFTNHAADRGGPTKWGITLATWRDYRKDPNLQAADVKNITEFQAREFYWQRFVVEPHFHQVADESLQELLIDAGVNHGTRHPAKWVQWAAEVPQDGVLGPVSLAAINAAAPGELFLWVCAFRLRLFGRLVSQDTKLKSARAAGFNLQAEFASGWNNRVAEFLEGEARKIEAAHRSKQ